MQAWRDEAQHAPGRWFNRYRTAEERANRTSAPASQPSGNQAFNTYQTVELYRLEVQENEFKAFLNRLCLARDKEEFDRFVAGRQHAGPRRLSSEQTGS